jgi:hypothetical protein
MNIPARIVLATSVALMASPALGGGSGVRIQGVPIDQPLVHHGTHPSPAAPQDQGARSRAYTYYGGPTLEQRPDPNYRNPYHPMFSLGATNPGQPHSYFQTRPDGFGYPTSQASPVYLGNGVYFIPR